MVKILVNGLSIAPVAPVRPVAPVAPAGPTLLMLITPCMDP